VYVVNLVAQCVGLLNNFKLFNDFNKADAGEW